MERYKNRSKDELIDELEQLKSNEILYHEIFDRTSDAVYILNKRLEFLKINTGAVKMYGYSEQELIGKTPEFVSAPGKNNMKQVKKIILKALKNKPGQFEFWGLRKNGEIFPKSVRVLKGQYQGKSAIFAFGTDITEQKKAEEKLKESETNLNAFFNTRSESIWSLDKNLNYLIFNDTFADYYLKTYKTVLKKGLNALEILNDDLKAFWEPLYKSVLAGNKRVFQFQAEINHKTETFEVFLNPVISNNTIIGISAISKNITKQKQIEQKLKNQEKQFRILTESAGDAIFVSDFETGHIIFANNNACKKLGYSKDELIKMEVSDLYPLFISDKYRKKIWDKMKFGKHYTFEAVHKQKNGTEFPVEVRAGLINFNDKKAVLGFARDISDRKIFEEKLKIQNKELLKAKRIAEENKTKFEILSNVTFEGILIHDNGIPVDMNNSFPKIFGYTAEEFKERDLIKLLVKKKYQNIVYKNIKNAYTLPYEVIGIKKNGTEFPVELEGKPFFDNKGKKYRVTAIRDISERKKAKKLLYESEERYKSLLEDLPVGVVVHQKNKIVYVNRKGIEIINAKKKSDLINQPISNFIPKDNYNEIINQIDDILQGQKNTIPIETQFVGIQGKTIDIEAISLPIKYNNELAVLLIGTDISRRKKAEIKLKNYQQDLEKTIQIRTKELVFKTKKLEKSQKAMRFLLEDVTEITKKLEETNKKLEESNKDLESFAYSVSHDLKTPLRAVSGYAEVLSEDFNSEFSIKTKEYLNLIIKNSKKMNMLIDDLLKFARYGKQIPDRSEFNLSVLVQDVFNDLKQNRSNKKIEFKLEKDIFINADIGSMKQVVFNLLNNALKFSKQNEHVIIEFGSTENENQNWFFIKDNGIGFDMEYHDEIFSVFKRLHSADKYEGTGIGLALVKRILEKHGGDIKAESEPGKGSIFYFKVN